MENENTEVKEFDLKTLWSVLCKFWILLIIVAVVSASVSLVYTRIFEKDTYVGKASFWVKGTISTSAQLAENLTEIIYTDELLRLAAKNEHNPNSDAKPLTELWNCTEDEAVAKLRSILFSGKSSDETCIFTVTVSSVSREMAYQAIDSIQYTLPVFIDNKELVDTTLNEVLLIGEVHSIKDISSISRPYLKNAIAFTGVATVGVYVLLLFIQVYKDSRINKNLEKTDTKE